MHKLGMIGMGTTLFWGSSDNGSVVLAYKSCLSEGSGIAIDP